MMYLLMLAVMTGALPSAAPASSPSVITAPDWIKKPNGGDINRLYPKAAGRNGVDGRAVIQCHVNTDGLLVDCEAIEESPPGEGFGDAAVAMATLFMGPMSRDGKPVSGGTVRIPILFRVPGLHAPLLQVSHPQLGRGRVVLDCKIAARRRYDNCVVMGLNPKGADLSEAALKLSARFVAPPGMRGTRVQIPIDFNGGPEKASGS